MNNLSFLIRKVSNIRESGSKGVGVKLGDMCGRLEASPLFLVLGLQSGQNICSESSITVTYCKITMTHWKEH